MWLLASNPDHVVRNKIAQGVFLPEMIDKKRERDRAPLVACIATSSACIPSGYIESVPACNYEVNLTDYR